MHVKGDNFLMLFAVAATKTIPQRDVIIRFECRRALFDGGGPQSVMVGGLLIC
jgi:hypothetical protein